MKREFYVDTPHGKLKVWAKHEPDCPDDYPGVFIDLVRSENEDPDMLACVEYNSADDLLQTCVYQPGYDEPCAIIVHEMEEDNETEI